MAATNNQFLKQLRATDIPLTTLTSFHFADLAGSGHHDSHDESDDEADLRIEFIQKHREPARAREVQFYCKFVGLRAERMALSESGARKGC